MTTVLLFKWTSALYGVWWASSSAPELRIRCIPHRQFCLQKKRPTWNCYWNPMLNKETLRPYPCKVREQVKGNTPLSPPIIRFADQKNHHSNCPEGNGGGNQLLDGSINLSPLILKYNKRFARQYHYKPQKESPLNSLFSSIVDHSSGPNTYVLTQTFVLSIGQLPMRLSRQLLSLCPQVCPPLNSHRC